MLGQQTVHRSGGGEWWCRVVVEVKHGGGNNDAAKRGRSSRPFSHSHLREPAQLQQR
jgi:hypothetical protein